MAAALLVGAGLIAFGNGTVVLAERTVPSGTVALIFALVPLWIALWDRLVGRRRLPGRVAVGLLLGFTGAALLVNDARLADIPLSGLLLAVAASMSWAGGSLFARNARLPHRPLVGNAMVMMAGGTISLIWGIARGELRSSIRIGSRWHRSWRWATSWCSARGSRSRPTCGCSATRERPWSRRTPG